MIKSTLSAIRSNLFINVIACILLAMLFVAEVNLYYTIYYNEFVVQERLRTNLSDYSYTYIFSDLIGKDDLDDIVKSVSGSGINYEDIVVAGILPEDEEGNSRELLCFYGGISNLHDFRSKMSHERFNDDLFERGDVLVTTNVILCDEYELNGKNYRLVQQVEGLASYGQAMFSLFCSSNEFFNVSEGVYRITFEFKAPIAPSDYDILNDAVSSKANIYNELKPSTSAGRAIETIGLSYSNIIKVFIIMVIVTTCVIPIIRYCLWLRRYEFRSYRVCGADASYITFCEVSHVAILGIMAVILGCIFSIQTLFTEGFWIMLLITIALFILRLLAEILISGKSNENIVEVNERWR